MSNTSLPYFLTFSYQKCTPTIYYHVIQKILANLLHSRSIRIKSSRRVPHVQALATRVCYNAHALWVLNDFFFSQEYLGPYQSARRGKLLLRQRIIILLLRRPSFFTVIYYLSNLCLYRRYRQKIDRQREMKKKRKIPDKTKRRNV